MNLFLEGCYHDALADSQGRVLWESSWRSNLIVLKCNLLLAALMKRHEGIQGILYWTIGEGEEEWDSIRPHPHLTTIRLSHEVARQVIAADQIVYLNDSNEPTETPSNRLEVSAEFRGEDFVSNGIQPLREFGLFGGDATEELNSGFMIDHVIHPRIDLTAELTLIRKLRLTFAAGAIQPEELIEFGAALPVTSIDGVGDEYASDLVEQDINSLGDMVEVDPLSPIGNIPKVKLREFRAKARMVTHLRVTLAPFAMLADRSISSLLSERPEDIAEEIGLPGITPEFVAQLQEELALLQIAMDNEQLQRITLGDLMSA